MLPKSQPAVTVRAAKTVDSPACGRICYDAFRAINESHGFPPDFPSVEAATAVLSMMFTSADFYCVVAEADGRIVGSNCLYEGSVICGAGPITVDPDAQNLGAGRDLMQAVIDRAQAQHAAGIRLVQAAFHNRSLSLYTKLGFAVREPLSCMQGRTQERNLPGCAVRPAQESDRDACNALSLRVHGFDRGQELSQAIQHKTALVVERGGRITGYASSLGFFGHSTAETNFDIQALMASVESFGGPGILVPSRNSGLLRWGLANGLQVVQPMTLMSMGLYNEPAGSWTPSILF